MSGPAIAQQIRFEPGPVVLLGEKVELKLSGWKPEQDVEIVADRIVQGAGPRGSGQLFRARAVYQVRADGSVDLNTQVPKEGSFRDADPVGLFWSMRPVSGNEPQPDLAPQEIQFTARQQATTVSARLRLLTSLPEVKVVKVDRFPGAVFASLPTPANSKRPALILLGGSEGGSFISRFAGHLASHGFAVLSLPYYSPPGWQGEPPELPSLPANFVDIPIERLNEARDFLRSQPEVDGDRIGVHGTSKGAEFALLAAVHFPWIKAVAAIVPTDVVWEGWGQGVPNGKRSSFALSGKPFAFVPYDDFESEFRDAQKRGEIRIRRPHDRGRALNPKAAIEARIPVEKIQAPVLVVGGHDDAIWASGLMAQSILETRIKAGLPTVGLIYVDAGHSLGGTGYNPTTQYDAGLSKTGGTPEGNARAQLDAWPKTLAFLKRSLGISRQ